MKNVLLILISLLTVSAIFAPQAVQISINENDTHPILTICEKLHDITFTFQGDRFRGTQYQNMTEFPPEVLDYINEQIRSKPEAVNVTKALSEVVFSAEILYNNSVCFNGSLMFNNSELKFFKLQGDPLKGSSDQHIALHVELVRLEEIVSELRTVTNGNNINILDFIGSIVKVGWTLIKMFFTGDLTIQPFTGIVKIFEGSQIILNMPDLSGMGQAMQDRIQQVSSPQMQNCINRLMTSGLSIEQATTQCLNQ
ncbi:Uncharacterised protein [Candidatus Tiddalikarchaeum anstoanum]|nr:Uncharacterised protein [Candidatus Tiddalikarchaeum anstoanum]